MQNANNIRTDVKVINAHILVDSDFYEKLFKELGFPAFESKETDFSKLRNELTNHIIKHSKRPIFFNVTTHWSCRDMFKDNLILTGLTYKYSKDEFDNIAVLKNNYENKFALDYINSGVNFDKSKTVLNYMNMSYIPSMILLHKHYKESKEDAKADKLKEMMLQIGTEANRLESILHYFGSNESNIREYPKLNIKKLERKFQKVGEALWASSTELSVGDYEQFLMDLVKNRAFDQLAICKIENTDWRAKLSATHQSLSDDIVFHHGHPDDENMPIQNISYEAAKLYCEWLTNIYNNSTYKKKKYDNVVFRLPTEQEWEMAARAGHKDALYPWGGYYYQNIDKCYLSNFNVTKDKPCEECKSEHPANDGGFFTVHIDAYYPNDFGCYNMSGNVAEMTANKGVARGGSWEDAPENCTVTSAKNYTAPSPAIGFRVFMEVK